jgi:hypothetical protein
MVMVLTDMHLSCTEQADPSSADDGGLAEARRDRRKLGAAVTVRFSFRGGGTLAGGQIHQYDVTRDGLRFLVLATENSGAPLRTIVNWQALLPKQHVVSNYPGADLVHAPIAILGPLAGVFVDRWPIKATMVASDLVRAVLAML